MTSTTTPPAQAERPHRMDGTRVIHKAVGSRGDRWFDRLNVVFVVLVVLVIGYPLWFVIIESISDPQAVQSGKAWLWPRETSRGGYQRVYARAPQRDGYRYSH